VSGSSVANLAPVPSESSTCPNCSAPLVADQRYCLSCGQPVSPVRLAFLDVLESERQPQLASGAVAATPVAYAPYVEPAGGPKWARRYTPLFAVASVLLLAMLIGLLLGHWVSQSKSSSGPQVVKIEGLASAPAAASGPSSATTATTTTPASAGKTTSSAKSAEEKEQAEAKAEEKAEEKAAAKAPPAKNGTQAVQKLEKTTGKKHEEELNKITSAPIEVK
jgi:hypothetical protein